MKPQDIPEERVYAQRIQKEASSIVTGVMRDVRLGKQVEVAQGILNKLGRLTEDEFTILRGHVVLGRDILAETPGIASTALAVAAEHHEHFDGSGYPRGLKGDEITLYGQMAAVVDVYDAITADRCYHKGEPPTSVLKKLLEWSKFQFYPELVQHFIQAVGIYPAGTRVRLESGRLATVVESGKKGCFIPWSGCFSIVTPVPF